MTRPREPFEKRFFAKVEKGSEDDCWIWKGSRHGYQASYGASSYQGKRMSAHVASYLYHKGAIPEGHEVMHTCDNRLCVNPKHLVTGTHLENIHDRDQKGRTWVPRGEDCKKKLTRQDVDEIRKLLAEGELSQREIGARFGVSGSYVSTIKNGIWWGWYKSPEDK